MKRFQIVHPLLFSILPILSIYAVQPGLVALPVLIGPLVTALTLTLALFFLLAAWTNSGKAAAVSSVWALNSLTHHVAFDGLRAVFDSVTFPIGEKPAYFLVFWITWPLLLSILILRSKVDWVPINAVINVVATVLVFSVIGKIISIEVARPSFPDDYPRDSALRSSTIPEASQGIRGDSQRDIYYLVFDRYANAHTLNDVYGFDNTGFLAFLTDRGFYVANESRANYSNTAQSLSSTLNLEHINYLEDDLGADSAEYGPLHRRLADHHVLRYLRARGYEFIQLGNWWEPTRTNFHADRVFVQYRLSEFSRTVLEASVLPSLGEQLGIRPLTKFEHDCDQLWNQFNDLVTVIDEPGPKFVFSHFILPHQPWIFDSEGRCLAPSEIRQRDGYEGYTAQLRFANELIEEFVDRLNLGTPDDPIVIVQADEGPYPEEMTDWESASAEQLRQKMGVLNAYYLPSIDSSAALYPSMTSVNTFRVVFNAYFGEEYDLLEDRVYSHRDNRFYGFLDISDVTAFAPADPPGPP